MCSPLIVSIAHSLQVQILLYDKKSSTSSKAGNFVAPPSPTPQSHVIDTLCWRLANTQAALGWLVGHLGCLVGHPGWLVGHPGWLAAANTLGLGRACVPAGPDVATLVIHEVSQIFICDLLFSVSH